MTEGLEEIYVQLLRHCLTQRTHDWVITAVTVALIIFVRIMFNKPSFLFHLTLLTSLPTDQQINPLDIYLQSKGKFYHCVLPAKNIQKV